jgi:hypothetical protein
MSKSFKSRLTGSGRKPRRASRRPKRGPAFQAEAFLPTRPTQGWLNWLDGLDDCCRTIETLAGLLLVCSEDVLEGELARGAGYMINKQVRQLKALREQLAGQR